MKSTKINFFSVNDRDIHKLEYTKNFQLNTRKPLTKIIIREVVDKELIEKVNVHNRNSVYFSKPISDVFGQENVTRFYCTKAKKYV